MHTQDLCVPDLAVCFPGDDQQVGDLAQMVERMLSMHEAQGSIPCFSTFFLLLIKKLGFAKKSCRDRGSNTGPLDLQSNALPTELSQLGMQKIHPVRFELTPSKRTRT